MPREIVACRLDAVLRFVRYAGDKIQRRQQLRVSKLQDTGFLGLHPPHHLILVRVTVGVLTGQVALADTTDRRALLIKDGDTVLTQVLANPLKQRFATDKIRIALFADVPNGWKGILGRGGLCGLERRIVLSFRLHNYTAGKVLRYSGDPSHSPPQLCPREARNSRFSAWGLYPRLSALRFESGPQKSVSCKTNGDNLAWIHGGSGLGLVRTLLHKDRHEYLSQLIIVLGLSLGRGGAAS